MSEEKAKVVEKVEKKEPDAIPQNGVIVFGGGLDAEYWMAEARAEGFKVTPTPEYAILYKEPKKK